MEYGEDIPRLNSLLITNWEMYDERETLEKSRDIHFIPPLRLTH